MLCPSGIWSCINALSSPDVSRPLTCFETLGTEYPVTWRHIGKERKPHKHNCENLRPSKSTLFKMCNRPLLSSCKESHLYSGAASRPGNNPSWLRYSRYSSVHSGECWDSALNYVVRGINFFYYYYFIRHSSTKHSTLYSLNCWHCCYIQHK